MQSQVQSTLKLAKVTLFCAACLLPLTGMARADNSEIISLGMLNGGASSSALGISGDGSVVVGQAGDGASGNEARAIRWTQATGMQSLGTLNGGIESSANGISSDGSVIVGTAPDGAAGNATRAFRWTQGTGMQSLGTLNGGVASYAYAISGDGLVVVGRAADGAAGNASRAFRWTQGTGMQSLGILNGGNQSYAYGASNDGSVIVGEATDGAAGNMNRAFRWTEATGMQSLGVINGGNVSRANGVSSDGTVIVGYAADGAAGDFYRAFRWTEGSGMQNLGTLNGGISSRAFGTSSDGSVIVGNAQDGAAGNTNRAFRWTQATGLQTVEDWLRDNDVVVPVDITDQAFATNTDGSVVVGRLADSSAFVARVATAGSGLITLAEVQNSLSDTANAGQTILSTTQMTINGAHSRPMARRVATGKSLAWVAGDWGEDDHGKRSGSAGLAELGGGYNWGPAQTLLSFGRTYGDQNMTQNGRVIDDGNYVLVENIIPLGGPLWATLGAHYSWGETVIKRGYLNAGAQDISRGETDQSGWGFRARVDWENAYQNEKIAASPYLDFTRTTATLDGYTETSGGFPAYFNTRQDHATELRLGANTSSPLTKTIRFITTAEGVHRFEEDGARMKGEVIGVSSFDLAGEKNKQDWLRGGLGLEADAAGGTASMMLNATTRGEMPNYWLALSYQMAF